jgi:hypothetical protein
MVQDKRYNTVRFLIEGGHISEFVEIFEYIPLSVVALDMGNNYVRFKRLVGNPSRIKLTDIFILARLFGITEMAMVALILATIKNKRKR